MDATVQHTKKHPPGLYLLFFTEMWERFSYYGMRGLLVLYLTTSYLSGGLGVKESTAMLLYGIFTGTVYFTPILGGYLTDRFLGRRFAITLGGIIMAAGNFVLFALHSQIGLYIGLSLLIIGNGFFKPNISTLVGELYGENDRRKDSAFTIFYMGINLGAVFAPLVCGFLAEDFFKTTVDGVEKFGFKYGFLAACIGMIIGQIIFNVFGPRYLGDIGKEPTNKKVATSTATPKEPLSKKEKQRTAVILILTCFSVFFWAGFEQAGSSFTLYTQKFVDRSIFGWTMPISWFQSINPLFIILFAPIISLLSIKLASTKRGDFSAPTKMGIALILMGGGFIVLLASLAGTGTDPDHVVNKANILFIIMTYFFHTIAELYLSPVGLSMVSTIAPVKLTSLLMGVWLAGSGIANYLAGGLAAFTSTLGFAEVFMVIGGTAVVLGILLLVASPKLQKMMNA
ncbi:peptide MFS transporter [Ectobacillus antri]|jgi:POT family proton-dependent oligopeptide transporter|uniref:Peptide MFS transporter n=1 Tax=Ectobacillus antri TaxID=2486280 RepID=A0ABT6H531_9BACI|nr:peptide MFS transporter [Ectobacillus antri]MDG4657398.1 peptide MFS transporter [Ectobacillus antri]MDG5754471.1 peptide MFS transporter [Ectobacillus antri]